MREDLTDITILLDRSGSMSTIRDGMLEVLNAFIKGQREAPGAATLTLVRFDSDDPYEVVFDSMPITCVEKIVPNQFVPRGSTPLNDAMMRTVEETGKRLRNMPEMVRPAKVIFVIVTDGQENSSTTYRDPAPVREKIQHQRKKYGWEFVYFGANQDAVFVAGTYGIPAHSAMTYAANTAGLRAMAFSLDGGDLGRGFNSYRAGTSSAVMMSDEDRKKQEEALGIFGGGTAGGQPFGGSTSGSGNGS